MIQSCLPSRLTVTMLETGDLVETRAVTGVVEEIFWYKKGIPTGARLKGSRKERVESVFSDLPLRPIRVPRRVKRVCEAERETERRDMGVPRTSKCASNEVSNCGCPPRLFIYTRRDHRCVCSVNVQALFESRLSGRAGRRDVDTSSTRSRSTSAVCDAAPGQGSRAEHGCACQLAFVLDVRSSCSAELSRGCCA